METAQTADYALQALLSLEAHGDQSLQEIATRLELSRRVTQRVMATLHQGAMVTRGARGQYSLGPALIALARNLPHKLVSVAEPIVKDLERSTGEMVILTVPEGDEGVLVDRRGSDTSQLRVEFATGFRHPLAVGASGRAILAHLPQRQERAAANVEAELATIRARGYAQSSSEFSAHTVGIAAPILDNRNVVVGSVGLVAPIERAELLDRNIERLLAAARDIERAYDDGYSGRPDVPARVAATP